MTKSRDTASNSFYRAVDGFISNSPLISWPKSNQSIQLLWRHKMFDYRDFQQVFPAGAQLPYDHELQAEIDNSRKTFHGVLFIDRVMKALGLTKSV